MSNHFSIFVSRLGFDRELTSCREKRIHVGQILESNLNHGPECLFWAALRGIFLDRVQDFDQSPFRNEALEFPAHQSLLRLT